MKPIFHKRYFIERQIQTKVIIFIIILLMIYTLLFVVILFIPFIVPLSFDYLLNEQTDAVRMLLSLHTSIWPALAIVTILLADANIFVSHKRDPSTA